MKRFLLLFAAVLFESLSGSSVAQSLAGRISPDGKFEAVFQGDGAHYFVLRRGDSVSAIHSPVALSLGADRQMSLTDPRPIAGEAAAYFRVEQVPLGNSLDLDSDVIPDVWELIQAPPLNPLNPLDAEELLPNGLSRRDDYLRSVSPLVSIQETSPAEGERGVSVTRKTILRFSMPLSPDAVLSASNFYATFAGRKLLSRVELSSDRKTAFLFYQEPIPGSARINVTFDGGGISDYLQRPIDPDGDGQPGGVRLLAFDTQSTAPIASTAVIGRVYAAEPIPAVPPVQSAGDISALSPFAKKTLPANATKFANKPLKGVTITVDGMEETIRAVTDSNGEFVLTNAPSGRFFVHVDGRTAEDSSWPAGDYYPFVGKAWEAVAGVATNLAGGDGVIFLPLVVRDTLQPISIVNETKVTFPATVLAKRPELAGVELDVPPNALIKDDGTRGGKLGIAPVPPDRLPEKLPPGLSFPLVLTIQTDGPQTFDTPVPVRFPNLPDPATGIKLNPGEKSALWSFNHDTGRWEIQGAMRVTPDGQYLESEPGVGVRQPGWHGAMPGAEGAGGGVSLPTGVDPCALERELLVLATAGCGGGIGADLATELVEHVFRRKIPGSCLLSLAPALSATRLACHLRGDARCLEEIAQTMAETALECIPFIGDAFPVLFCIRDIGAATRNLRQCDAQSAVRRAMIFSAQNDYFADQVALLTALAELYELYLGDRKWLSSSLGDGEISGDLLKASLRAFSRSSDGAASLTIEERQHIFALSRPSHISAAEITLLLQRLASIASGTISESEFPLDDFNLKAAKLSSISHRLSEQGWSGVYDGLRNGLEELSALLNSRPTSASAANLNIFYRIERLDDGFVLRGATRFSEGIPATILAPKTFYSISYSTPDGLFGKAYFSTPAEGVRFEFPAATALVKSQNDSDLDGLSDISELVIGTNYLLADTDGDGIPDNVELAQGTDAFNGHPVATGVIASVDTPGSAIDIAAVNNIVAVASNSPGISILQVEAGAVPTLVAQVPTSSPTRSVAITETWVAATTDAGVSVIDASDPASAYALYDVAIAGATAVCGSGGIFYAAAGVEILTIDAASGLIINRRGAGGTVHDLVLAGDHLFVLLANELQSYRLNGPDLEYAGRATVSSLPAESITARKRLFVGGGVAHVTSYPGYQTISVQNPSAMTPIASATTGGPNSFKQVVLNGSGLGLAAVGENPRDDGTHDVYLYDTKDPLQTGRFLTSLRTPGIAHALSIYNGIAYVADGSSGLQVVNYLAYDNRRIPPTVALDASFNLNPASVEEGKLVRVTARVTDDVQVRNVEFYVDGLRITTDGNYPFETRFTSPLRTDSKTSFIIRARATDTGGNAAWSDEITVALTQDSTAPRIRRVIPASSESIRDFRSVFAFYSEPLNPATLVTDNFTLTYAGADSRLDTADDQVIPVQRNYRSSLNAAVFTLPENAPNGLYRYLISSNITDRAGFKASSNEQATVWHLSDGLEGDQDGDGLTNRREIDLGTNPINADTDGDDADDGLEVEDGGNPVNPAVRPRITVVAYPPVMIKATTTDEMGTTGTPAIIGNPPLRLRINVESEGESFLPSEVFAVAQPPLSARINTEAEDVPVPTGLMANPPLNVHLRRETTSENLGADEIFVIALPPAKVLISTEAVVAVPIDGNVFSSPSASVTISSEPFAVSLPPVSVLNHNEVEFDLTRFLLETATVAPSHPISSVKSRTLKQ